MRVEQDAGKEAADEGADDPEHDVADHPQAFVTADEEPGEIAGDRAEDDPRNDVHEVIPPSLRIQRVPEGPGYVRECLSPEPLDRQRSSGSSLQRPDRPRQVGTSP